MKSHNLPAVRTGVVELLSDARLSPEEMCSMNFARDEFDKLYGLLRPMLTPLMQGDNPVASDIARHLEQVRIFSANFCWKHRHLGASFGVVGKRPGIDIPEA